MSDTTAPPCTDADPATEPTDDELSLRMLGSIVERRSEVTDRALAIARRDIALLSARVTARDADIDRLAAQVKALGASLGEHRESHAWAQGRRA